MSGLRFRAHGLGSGFISPGLVLKCLESDCKIQALAFSAPGYGSCHVHGSTTVQDLLLTRLKVQSSGQSSRSRV